LVPRLILLPRQQSLGAGLRSAGTSFAEPSGSFTVTPTLRRQPGFVHLQGLSILQLYRDPKSQPSTGLSIWTALSGQRNLQSSAGTLSRTTNSQPFTGILQKLMPARAAGGNSLKPPGR